MMRSRNLIGTYRVVRGVGFGRQNTVMGWACSWLEKNYGGMFCWTAPVSKTKNVVRVDLRLVSCQDREVTDLAQVCLVLKMKAPRSSETSRAIGPMTQRHIPYDWNLENISSLQIWTLLHVIRMQLSCSQYQTHRSC